MSEWRGRRLHFVGIGGAGMSGLALIADALGATVTGSDQAPSPYLERVRAAGIAVTIGHDAANVPAGDDVELVVSTAIGAANPERSAGRERGLREIHRGALLGELSRLRRTIAIAGTHGKTTTASMAAHALLSLGWDPTFVIGGELRPPGEPGARARARAALRTERARGRTLRTERASGSSSRPTSPTARSSSSPRRSPS